MDAFKLCLFWFVSFCVFSVCISSSTGQIAGVSGVLFIYLYLSWLQLLSFYLLLRPVSCTYFVQMYSDYDCGGFKCVLLITDALQGRSDTKGHCWRVITSSKCMERWMKVKMLQLRPVLRPPDVRSRFSAASANRFLKEESPLGINQCVCVRKRESDPGFCFQMLSDRLVMF